MLAGEVARQRHHRGRAEQADMDAGRAEPRLGGGDGEVAGGDELAAGSGGKALDRGDDGLRQGDDLLHHGGAAAEDVGEIGAAAVGIGSPGAHLLEVMAGGEAGADGGEHHGADAAVRRDGGEGVGQARQHPLGQGVAARRVIEGQRGDAVRIRAAQDRRGDGGGGRGSVRQAASAFCKRSGRDLGPLSSHPQGRRRAVRPRKRFSPPCPATPPPP